MVKTASPLTFARAPKLLPWKIGPSLIVKVARSNDGLVDRVGRGSGERDVLLTTVALCLTCVEVSRLTAAVLKMPAAGFRHDGLHALLKMTVAMI